MAEARGNLETADSEHSFILLSCFVRPERKVVVRSRDGPVLSWPEPAIPYQQLVPCWIVGKFRLLISPSTLLCFPLTVFTLPSRPPPRFRICSQDRDYRLCSGGRASPHRFSLAPRVPKQFDPFPLPTDPRSGHTRTQVRALPLPFCGFALVFGNSSFFLGFTTGTGA